jgi:pimeloyl-ACP methyl ester carboxylesterase
LLHTGGVEDILEETKKLIPKAHVIEMKGIGHMIQIEAIEDTNRILSQIVSLEKNQAP